MPPAVMLFLLALEMVLPPLAVIGLVSWAVRLRQRGSRRWWLPLLPLALPAAWLAQLFYGFAPQVNASLTVQLVAREVAVWRSAQQSTRETQAAEQAATSHLERGDYWGHPFLYLHDADCFVLVSYGSDGKPDPGETYDLSLCSQTTKRSTCTWPTMDTVFVNGEPLRYCLK